MLLIIIISSIKNGNKLILSKADFEMSREDFLNKTFCGKFLNENWIKTINKNEIDKENDFIQRQIKIWENFSDELSCEKFISMNSFYSKQITNLEENNPMAFTILVYKHFYQFQVLIRTLYSRTNFHCIHIDLKASNQIYKYALKLTNCLSNVYLVKQRINISWATFSILQAERICQKILIEKSSKWFYYMTIAVS